MLRAKGWAPVPLVLFGLSVLGLFWIPLVSTSPFADLSGQYTDHLNHVYFAYLFGVHGPSIYQFPVSHFSSAGFPFPAGTWPRMPAVYPPGMFVLFAPLVLLAKVIPLSPHAFSVVASSYVLLLANLSFLAMAYAVTLVGGRFGYLVLLACWLMTARLGLQGFYDPTYVGCGAMALAALHLRRPEQCLGWLCLAALLHYRAVIFVPVGMIALAQCVRDLPRRALLRTLSVVALAGALCLGSFALMLPATAVLREEAGGPGYDAAHLFWIVTLSLFAASICGFFGHWLAAASVIACAVLGLMEIQHFWWHGALLLVPLLCVGVRSGQRGLGLTRLTLLSWAFRMEMLVWHGKLAGLGGDLLHGCLPWIRACGG